MHLWQAVSEIGRCYLVTFRGVLSMCTVSLTIFLTVRGGLPNHVYKVYSHRAKAKMFCDLTSTAECECDFLIDPIQNPSHV